MGVLGRGDRRRWLMGLMAGVYRVVEDGHAAMGPVVAEAVAGSMLEQKGGGVQRDGYFFSEK